MNTSTIVRNSSFIGFSSTSGLISCPLQPKISVLHMIAAYLEIKDQICDHDGVGREMANSILKPPFDSLGTESDQMTQLAKGQSLFAEGRHVPNTTPGVASDIVDGPECFGLKGFRVLRSRFLIFHTNVSVSNMSTADRLLHPPSDADCCATMDCHDNA